MAESKKITMDLKERLLSKINVSDNGCWEFTGANRGNGYGTIKVDGKAKSACLKKLIEIVSK